MKRKFLLISVIIALLVLLAPWVVPLFSPWSAINCERQEIDILTGMRRDTRLLYWLPVHRRFGATLLSPEISSSAIPHAKWRVVNTFCPYAEKISPHHAYHAAFSQMRTLGLIWEQNSFDTARRRESRDRLLKEWQASGNAKAAGHYLRELSEAGENLR